MAPFLFVLLCHRLCGSACRAVDWLWRFGMFPFCATFVVFRLSQASVKFTHVSSFVSGAEAPLLFVFCDFDVDQSGADRTLAGVFLFGLANLFHCRAAI